jgi:hypothetical protein
MGNFPTHFVCMQFVAVQLIYKSPTSEPEGFDKVLVDGVLQKIIP